MRPKMLSTNEAEVLIRGAFVGAQLIEVKAMSMLLTLSFETTKIFNDIAVGITLSILTSASFLDSNCDVDTSTLNEQRSRFICGAYKEIGSFVKSVNLFDTGRLQVEMGSSIAALFLDEEDRELDDSVWTLEIESIEAPKFAPFKYITCIVEGEKVSYYMASSGQPGKGSP